MKVLVINSGSSSLKAQLMDTSTGDVFANVNCERVGLDGSFLSYKKNGEKVKLPHDMPNHKIAFQFVLDTLMGAELAALKSLDEVKAVGHRLVNFGDKYNKSIIVTSEILKDLETCIHYSPLHNNAAILGIKACMELMPKVKNVAVFDTAFHSTMPEKAFMYAIPYEYYENNKIRRYGAHGTSHRYIAKKVEELYGDLKGKKLISCHLGSGSSICAIKDGKCVDTSMGYTPLAGVVMGTRSGDIDPSVIKDMMEISHMNIDEVTNTLNKKSGWIGITGGISDSRDIEDNLDNPRVKLAFDMQIYSIIKYIGAYTAAMGGLDYLVFTAGIGENSFLTRREVSNALAYLGVKIDEEKNEKLNFPSGKTLEISTPDSKVKVLRIPTNEEYMIAMDTAELAK